MCIDKYEYTRIDRLLELLIPLLIILQVHTSLLWYNTPIIASLLVCVIFALSYFNNKKIILPNTIAFVALLISIIVFVVIHFQGSSIVTLLAFFFTFQIKDSVKLNSLNNLTKSLFVIISVTLPLWFIHINDIYTFPLYRLLDLSFLGTEAYLEDYMFFIYDPTLLFPRFYSIFEEPGIFALLLSFVLTANKYNFNNKENIVLLLGLIFTFSLTGYIISFIGFVLTKIRNISSFIIVSFVICVIIYLLSSFFEDVFDQLIVERITNMDERGINHRTDYALNRYYDTYILTLDVIWGKGYSFVGGRFTGDSYKIFIISYGLLGLVSIFLIWYSIYKCYRKDAKIMLLAYVVAFLPLSAVFISWRLVLFSIACTSLAYSNKKI